MLKLWILLDARRAAVRRQRELQASIAADRAILAELDESQRKAHEQLFGPAPAPRSIPAGLVLGRASW